MTEEEISTDLARALKSIDVSKLTPRGLTLFTLISEGATLEVMAKVLKISRERVRQITGKEIGISYAGISALRQIDGAAERARKKEAKAEAKRKKAKRRCMYCDVQHTKENPVGLMKVKQELVCRACRHRATGFAAQKKYDAKLRADDQRARVGERWSPQETAMILQATRTRDIQKLAQDLGRPFRSAYGHRQRLLALHVPDGDPEKIKEFIAEFVRGVETDG